MDRPFRIAYLVDAFPRRTEHFILREVAAVLPFWPELRVYSLRNAGDDWDNVEQMPELRSVPVSPLRMPFGESLLAHGRFAFSRPLAYLSVLVRSLRLHGARALKGLRRFDQAVRLARLARRDKIEHLHAHFASEPALLCHLAGKALDIPYTVSAHARDVWVETAPRAVLAEAATCIVCSETARDCLTRRFPGLHLELVRHGLARGEARTPPPPAPPLRLVAAGRFVPKKGFDVLIEACWELRKANVEFQCDIFGDGSLASDLGERIRTHGLSENVRLHGFVSHEELCKWLAEAHVFVAPCRVDPDTGDRDGIPNVVLEAMAVGAIVIAGDLPSLREAVIEGETGFLVPPDDPLALSDACRRVLHTQNDWPRLRQAARALLAERFDLETNARRFRQAVEEAHSASARGGTG